MNAFQEILDISRHLRKECPFDKEQTLDSVRNEIVSEANEVVEAINEKDMQNLKEEIGDVIWDAVFLAVLAEEAGHFTIEDSLKAVRDKMIRRHPHIFGDAIAETPEEVRALWKKIKEQEKTASSAR
ncbi:MAG: MazG nucleotide pyrophosphohydrolase domain-containing protein [Nanoarchaeota archaeon]